MIERPERQIEAFAKAGADVDHGAPGGHAARALRAEGRPRGRLPGRASRSAPARRPRLVAEVADDIDLLLCMTVNPGWGGQPFIEHSIEKLERLQAAAAARACAIEVDGGIDASTAPRCAAAGASLFVAGSAVFGAPDPADGLPRMTRSVDAVAPEWRDGTRGPRGTAAGRGALRAAARVRRAGELLRPGRLRGGRAATSRRWWERWAKELDWFEPWQTVLEWNAPWAKWFQEGKLNASHNCLDRHVDAGRGDKVAYHWVGEDGDTRDVTYAELLDDDEAVRERPEVARRREGRRRRDLHADDPGDARRDARVRAHRRHAQRRLRRLLRRVGEGADGGLRREAARDRQREPAPRQADPDEGAGRRGARRPAEDGARRRREARRHRHADEGRPRRLVARGGREGRRRLPGRAARRRAPALHPLHVGLDREAEGHPAHDRRLPDRRVGHPQAPSST